MLAKGSIGLRGKQDRKHHCLGAVFRYYDVEPVATTELRQT